MRKMTDDGQYLQWDKLTDLAMEDLQNYWGRKNKLVIVTGGDGEKRLVFLVEDVERPKVPGYPVSGIEYFANQCEAVLSIKNIFKVLNYTPTYQEYEFFSVRR